jgi:predicted alpha/beta-hydrolase family hydrolase
MYSFETLNIRGYRNEPVANTFLRQKHDTHHLAVLFPGLGYTAHMPVLYYPGQLLVDRGADVLRVEYAYIRRPDYQAAPGAERARWLYADVSAALDLALAQREYGQVTLIGKSIGTRAAGHLLSTRAHLPRLQCIWLTPLLRDQALCAQIKQVKHRALFVIGTADSQYDAGTLAEVRQATGGDSLVIDGADHGLEIGGDVVQSIRVMQQVIEGIQRFLG